MSIAPSDVKRFKVCRTLMCLAARRVFYIKVLKDLDNETARISIDM